MKLTPNRPVCACLNALRTTSGTVCGSITCVQYFEIGRNRLTRSRCWWLSLCMDVVAAWPEMATMRRVIQVRVGHAGDQVRGPGPQSRQAHARLAGQPPVNVGHERRRLLVPGSDELDRTIQHDVHHVQVFLARQPE